MYIFYLPAIILLMVFRVRRAPWITERKIPFSDAAVNGATEPRTEVLKDDTWSTILKDRELTSVLPPLTLLRNCPANPVASTFSNVKSIL